METIDRWEIDGNQHEQTQVLLRGNHEEKMMNQQFGFIDEIESRLGSKNGMKLYDDEIYPLFQALPLAARIDGRILCIHGGPGVCSFQSFHTIMFQLRQKNMTRIAYSYRKEKSLNSRIQTRLWWKLNSRFSHSNTGTRHESWSNQSDQTTFEISYISNGGWRHATERYCWSSLVRSHECHRVR